MHGRNFSWRHIILSFLCAGTLTGCGGVEVGCLKIGGGHTADKPTSNMVYKSLAEQMWELARDISTGSGTGENAAEKIAIWEANKTKFINAFNSFLPKDDAKLFSSTAGEVFAFIDDGTIPKMTDSAASMIELLYTNPEDPDKRALKGLHALMQQQDSTLDPDATLELLGRLIAHKEFEDFIASIGQVVRENDGVDANGEPNGEKDLLTDLFKMIGEKLEESNVQNSSANNLQGMVEHLLSTRDLPAELDLGDPAWIVEVDDNRNPIVAVDPNTGTLYEPFVDTNLDGEADINTDGNHIDANGDLIDIPAFGRTGCRDGQRRALCEAGGEPIYVYFDGKRTALAGVMMLVGDLLEEDVPRKLRPVAQAMLGTRVNNDNGTPSDPTDDYMHYPEQDNPLLDLVWSVMELTRAPEINNLTDNLGGMNISESKTSERLVLYTGKVLKAFQEEDFFKEYPDWIKLIDLVDDLLPIADEVFEKANATSKSTGEILMEVLKDLADDESGEEVDSQFGQMIQYRNLVYDDTPNGQVLNTSQSIPVDFTLPMYNGNDDNRSVVERTIMLLVLLDGPTLPFSSKNLADIALESFTSTGGGNGFMDFILGAADVPLVEMIAVPILNLLGYPGQKVWDEIEVYDSLTASGSTEGFSTVLKVFEDQGQMDLVINIFHILENDLQRDLDSDPYTFSMIRKSEEPLAEILLSTVMNDITTLLDTMEEANNSSSATTDYSKIADAIAYLIDDDAGLIHRDGTPAKSRIHWLTRPFREMLLRVENAGEFENLTGTLKSVLNLITDSTMNDNGTPGDTTDDFEELTRRWLAPVLTALNTYTGQGSTQTQQELDDFVDEQQATLLYDMTGKALPSGIDLWTAIDESATSGGFYMAIRNLLLPHPGATYKDAFASLMKIIGQALESGSGTESEYAADLNGYFASILDDHNGYIIDIVLGFEAIATAGVELSILELVNNFLWKGEDGTLISPAEDILDIARELAEVGKEEGAEEEELTVEDLEENLKDIVEFVRDDKVEGLPKFYDILKSRNK